LQKKKKKEKRDTHTTALNPTSLCVSSIGLHAFDSANFADGIGLAHYWPILLIEALL
jgi:hypothetical protein